MLAPDHCGGHACSPPRVTIRHGLSFGHRLSFGHDIGRATSDTHESTSEAGDRSRGQSRIRDFLQDIEQISDCGGASKCGSLPHDLRPLDPHSAGFSRHLPLRVALRATRLALWRRSRERPFVSLRRRQAHSKPLPKIIDVAPTWKLAVAAGPPL